MSKEELNIFLKMICTSARKNDGIPSVYQSSSLKDCYNISFSNDGGLKLSHLDTFDMLFPFLAFVKL